ncbi:ribonuclease HII [Christiangramia sp. SM2212]|uniref:Ribonuclease HII n=1 Tax=Christiangramia sediminicola TaxID=3073267 RepID=A0ABU1EUB7_9FLAO|nr:ribonuclease HII [Christiangramia sp. SM2212]MDR5591987.1 ribonuclease HII [Christiangramia sp. SM2212]
MLNFYNIELIVAGTDEAGRGCLAGPVTAAAVILPQNFTNDILNDSKITSLKNRELLKSQIQSEALAYGIDHVFMDEIDKINILNASILAMHRALQKLKLDPEHIIVDGNKFKPFKNISHECIIKGDGKFMSIAAASILAKTSRDEFMQRIHEEYPEYNWKKNKGYPTKEHRAAIEKHGINKYHRKSFKLLPDQLKIDF